MADFGMLAHFLMLGNNNPVYISTHILLHKHPNLSALQSLFVSIWQLWMMLNYLIKYHVACGVLPGTGKDCCHCTWQAFCGSAGHRCNRRPRTWCQRSGLLQDQRWLDNYWSVMDMACWQIDVILLHVPSTVIFILLAIHAMISLPVWRQVRAEILNKSK